MKSFISLIALLCYLNIVVSKGFTKDILNYFDLDNEIFLGYRDYMKELSCKVMVYSKMKSLYEKEVIDKYMKKISIESKLLFLNDLENKMLEKCIYDKFVSQECFNQNLFIEFDETLDQFVNVDIEKTAQSYYISDL